MAHLVRGRSHVIAFMAIGALSALSMIWLFWHHPLGTSLATIVVLAAFAISARLARMIESDGHSELIRGKRTL